MPFTVATKNIRKLNLRQRLGLGLAILALPLLLLTMSGYGLFQYSLSIMDEGFEQFNEEFIPVSTLQESLLRAVMPPNDYLIHGNIDERRNFKMLKLDVDDGFSRAMKVDFLDEQKNTRVKRALQEWMEAKNVAEKLLNIENPVNNKEAVALMEQLDRIIDDIYEELEHVCSATVSEVNKKHGLMHDASAQIKYIILGFFILISVVVLAGTLLIKRWIIAPLAELREGAQQFADMQLDYRIPVQSDDEIGLAAQTFNDMAAALKHDREIMYELSINDPLTGLLNRKEFVRLLELEISRAQRHGQSMCLLMLDIDYFKKINDSFGHPAGDVVLRKVAERMAESLRPTDIIARYGGEEFVILLPETNSSGASALAERICSHVRSTEISVAKEIHPTVTVSIGITSYPKDAATPESLIAGADKALYAAKNSGRNRYVNYSSLSEAG